ncbi:MAG: HDOD domain-containing protein [Desulfovibrionaceae bacterium]
MERETPYSTNFVARQPIFDSALDTWGYLMLFRNCAEAQCAVINDELEATAEVMATLPALTQGLPSEAKAMIRMPSKAIRENLHASLSPGNTAMVMAQVSCSCHEDIQAVKNLKDNGYLLAVDGLAPNCETNDLVRLADILVLDFARQSPEELRSLALTARRGGLTLMAKKVETESTMQLARELGVTLFHGYFYQKPATESGRRIPASKAARLRLFDVLQAEEPDFAKLATAIEPDTAISFRLLNFLNTPHFSFARKVTSIRQAVVLAGWTQVRNWLRLILITDIAPTEKTNELVYLAAHRARFLETLALAAGHTDSAPSFFLLGLFSVLDALFDMPMRDVLKMVSLENNLVAALCGEDSPYSPWLSLVRTIENGEWDAMGHLAMGLKLPTGAVSTTYREAFNWADDFFSAAKLS